VRLAVILVLLAVLLPALKLHFQVMKEFKFFAMSSGKITTSDFYHLHLNSGFVDVVNWLNKKSEKREDKVLLLYEARNALFKASTIYNTVHDRSPLVAYARNAEDLVELIGQMRGEGVRWVLVNERELARLVQFFAPEDEVKRRGIIRGDFMEKPGLALAHMDLYEPYWIEEDRENLAPLIIDFHKYIIENASIIREVAPGWPWYVYVADLGDGENLSPQLP
jgi:hypothetical protein